MKFVASISVLALVLLGANRFAGQMHLFGSCETASQTSCCGETDLPDEDHPAADFCCEDDENGNEHQCLPGCDCCCCFHMVAIQYSFISSFTPVAQQAHYADYHNGYRFELPALLFQPPRMG